MGSEGLVIAMLVLVAALAGMRFGVAAALFEIAVGAIAGNYLGFESPPWLPAFSDIGSLLLIFLAGSDIDVAFLRRRLRPALIVGSASYFAPFLATLGAVALFTPWPLSTRLLVAVACSDTSVAVVYPVLRDGGLLKVPLGKMLLIVALIPAFLLTGSLFVLFAPITPPTLLMLAILIGALVILRHASFRFLRAHGETSSEVKLRFLLAVLLAIAFLSEKGRLHASLAVFVLGALVGDLLKEQEETERRLRAVAFGIFVPMFYFKAGLGFSTAALADHWRLIALLGAVAFTSKFAAIYALSKPWLGSSRWYGAALLNARLTFGTIAASFGLAHGLIDRDQFSILISMIVLSSAVALLLCGKPGREAGTEAESGAAGNATAPA
jgi:Kef-type K+ transport system membrane component KefB